jgi:hypothetical protein
MSDQPPDLCIDGRGGVEEVTGGLEPVASTLEVLGHKEPTRPG